jgi:hypothetical protein
MDMEEREGITLLSKKIRFLDESSRFS